MSRKRLSILSKVDVSNIGKYERVEQKPSCETWSRLQQGLSGESVERMPCKKCKDKPPPIPAPPSFSFEIGHVYSIKDAIHGAHNLYEISPKYGTLCEFKYEGQQGIHRCFREASGGWTRTYTDAQLIGKQIEEVL